MITIDPQSIKTGVFHGHMLSAIAPRPIAFASTIDKNDVPNLSPYSFFNAFGSKPPTLIFSPARRVRDNTIKHTLENVYEVPEVVINMVSYKMIQQVSLSSCEYPKEVNEFKKAGFTELPSELIRPFRVKESPVQFECKVKQVIETGDQGGAGNLIICEILLMHIDPEVLDENERIDPNKIDLVGRCGYDWYSRASGNALFKVAKPSLKLGVGMDALPDKIRTSNILSGNDIATIGNLTRLPDDDEISEYTTRADVLRLIEAASGNKENMRTTIEIASKELIKAGKPEEAYMLLMITEI